MRARTTLNWAARSCSLPTMASITKNKNVGCRRASYRPLTALACLLPLLPVAAGADPYQVELLLFARPPDPTALPEAPGYRPHCLDRAQPVTTQGSGAAALVGADQHRLVPEAQAIQRRGSGMHLLVHTAWQQDLPAGSPGPWIRVDDGRALSGCLRAWLTPVPEVELEVAYETPAGERYGLYATAPVRPADVHYFDHPALGGLVRLDPLQDTAQPAPDEPAVEPATRETGSAPPPAAAPLDALPPPPKKPFRW